MHYTVERRNGPPNRVLSGVEPRAEPWGRGPIKYANGKTDDVSQMPKRAPAAPGRHRGIERRSHIVDYFADESGRKWPITSRKSPTSETPRLLASPTSSRSAVPGSECALKSTGTKSG